MLSKRSPSIMTVLAIFAIAGGSKTAAQGKPSAARPAPQVVTQAAPKLSAVDPCQTLTDAEVRQVFPDAKSASRDRRLETYDILACTWSSPTGHTYLQLSIWDTEPKTSIADELTDSAQGLVTDPLKVSVNEGLRTAGLETVNNVGDRAMAVVVPQADRAHFLQQGAILVAQRGQRTLRLESVDLAARGRAPALKALEELGRAAAKRL
jgi:hypothetical protein